MPDARGAIRTPLMSIATNPLYGATFSPGVPLPATSEQPVRVWDFPVAVNTNIRPRTSEPFGFPHLRAFSNVELVRMAIETRKDQIERLDWAIKPRDNAKGITPKIKDLTTFWQKPGKSSFATLMRALVEDLLSIDAPCAEKRRTRGGQLIGLDYIPGDTIAIKVDETGRIPEDPGAIAYQQIIKGTVWNDLSNRDVLYVPRNIRPGHIYGHSPVEQIVVTINTIMRRQAAQLAYFTAGNVPSGLLNAPEGWDLNKIKELQDWLDDKVTGNADEQAKILWGPAGSKYQAFKSDPIKDDFDEWLARVVAFAFSLPPTPFVRQMNKGTAGEDQDRALEEGLEPLKLWGKRWIDDIIATEQGAPDLEFVWVDTPSIDPGKQATIDDTNLRNATATIDEIRDTRGQDPLPDGMGKQPLVFTSTGPVLLKDVLAEPEPTPVEPGAPQQVVDENGMPVPPAAAPAPKAAPGKQVAANDDKAPVTASVAAEKLAKASTLISPDRPKARRHTAAIAKAIKPILARAGDEAAAEVAKALKAIAKEAPSKAKNLEAATSIASKVDLSALKGIGPAIVDDLSDMAADSGSLALNMVIDGADDDITNRVFDRAVDYAKTRAADLVTVDGDDSLIASTRAMIRDTIARGLEDNIGGDAIADALQEGYGFSAQRAELIAHTEIAEANGQGKKAGWQEVADSGVELVKGWTVSGDEGVCEDCDGNEAQGEIPFEEEFQSGDDMEPSHPGCLPGDSRVLALGVSAASKRWYDGDLVIIRTAGGKRLASTPNHPILTPRGWVGSGLLNIGDDVVCGPSADWEVVVSTDNQDMPPCIEDVAEAFGRSEQVSAMPVPTAAEDFHGDGEGSKVAVIFADRHLRNDAKAASGEQASQDHLARINIGLPDHSCASDLRPLLKAVLAPLGCDVSGGDLGVSLGSGHLGPLDSLGLGLRAPGDAMLSQNTGDDIALEPIALGDGKFGLSADVSDDDRLIVRSEPAALPIGFDALAAHQSVELHSRHSDTGRNGTSGFAIEIPLDKIVGVLRVPFSGHVYNLQTDSGAYVAEGIVTHNCRCATYAHSVKSDGTDDDSDDE